jgi:anaerobic dimethyl sulfoxide reductase subunit B (iron-sulfur subunit)
MARQWGFFVDSAHCSGCKACQVACKDRNDLGPGIRWRRVYEVAGGGWRRDGAAWVSEVRSYHLSLACNHCEDPICLRHCPTGAIGRTAEGIVLIDGDRCMGCRYCEWVCPYGAPQYDEATGRMGKCTLCAPDLARGEAPACVAACPMRVLEVGDLAELRARHGAGAQVYPLPAERHTRPALGVAPHASAAADLDWRVINGEEVRRG